MVKAKNKKLYFTLAISAILIATVVLAWPSKAPGHSLIPVISSVTNSKQARAVAPAFDKNTYPLDQASSLWAVINKGRTLPGNYVPAGLVAPAVALRTTASDPEMHVRPDVAAAMEKMFGAAKSDHLELMLASGYRSYGEQTVLYARYSSQSGAQQADTFSARPGHSEHQSGLAADIEPASRKCEVDQCFAATPEGAWLAANAYKYGFVIRYQKDTQQLTGYEYEPWHVRYVGAELAQQLYSSGQTLEQFFGLPTYPGYPATSYELKNQ